MSNKKERILWIGMVMIFLTCISACGKDDPEKPKGFTVTAFNPAEVPKTNKTVVYAHYMPWYETAATSTNGKWGIHWTMSNKNPELVDQNGKRQIASHFYPLTGPYASSDPDIIEYHLLLMKYSGIDGVLIDWYGSTDYNDYGSNRANSEALIKALGKVGMEYAIVYEDRTISEVIKKDPSMDRIEAAQNDMIYLEQNYFGDPNYSYVSNAPLLLVFGPEEFHIPSEWADIMSVFTKHPTFVTLNWKSNESAPHSVGEYIWVDQGSLDSKYSNRNKFEVFIGGAYPGFVDFYQEGGWGSGYFTIDHQNGETFKQTLQKAKNANVDYLQLITWNDYGEGTMIEPTEEFGFTFLEQVQEYTGVTYSKNEMEKILDLYHLRKQKTQNEDQKYLDQAFYYLVSLQYDKAVALIDSLK